MTAVGTTQTFYFALDLKNDPELIEIYKRFHEPAHIWPEIVAGIKEVGILEMKIFLAGDRLFMLLETPGGFDLDAGFKKMGELPRQREWAELMARFQQKLPFAKPGEHWVQLSQVFDLNS